MARRKARAEEPKRELTRKEHRIRAEVRERNRRLYIGVGAALGLALLLVLAGLVNEFVLRPQSDVATVGGTTIATRDYWKRVYFEQNQLQNQLIQLQRLESQFGGQSFFATQISQLQGILSSPFSLGVEVLDRMIRDEVIRQQAAARGITVSPEEVDQALREEVAAGQDAVTVPQATSTAEAGVAATATAAGWTPTPSPAVDVSSTVTATATPFPTPEPPPTRPILGDEQYSTGVAELEKNLKQIAGMSLDEYRQIIEVRLLNDKLSEVIGEEQVPATEEQVHARHILLRVEEPTPEATSELTATAELTATEAVTTAGEITAADGITAAEEVTAAEAVTTAAAITTTGEVTATEGVTSAAEITATEEITAPGDVITTQEVTATEEAAPRDDAATLALAQELQARLMAGEDFATLAQEYSDDTGSAARGGDLGWFGRGAMVAPFEEAAFSLEPGQISEPIKSDFGYHLIEVLEKDPNRPKDPAQLQQERQQAYQTWLQEQISATPIERPADLVSKLPRGLEVALPQIQAPAQQPATQ